MAVRTPPRPAPLNTAFATQLGHNRVQQRSRRQRSAAALSAAQKLADGVISQAEYRHILEMDQRLAELDASVAASS